MTNQSIQKSKSIKKTLLLSGVLAVVFALLLGGYFVVTALLDTETVETEQVVYEPIWEDEVEGVNGRVLLYPHFRRESINKITVHNPDNAVYGQQYVDWGFYRYNGPEKNEDDLIPGDFYLTNYEYATYDQSMLAYVITGAGYATTTARVEDHCKDFGRYGLDFDDPSEITSVTLEAVVTDEATQTETTVTYTYYIGDKTPSGSGYYVRVAGEDKLRSTGEVMERDSVYTVSPANLESALLVHPVKLITPTLTLPVDTQAAQLLDAFYVWKHEDKYLREDTDENGNKVEKYIPAIHIRPVEQENNPFAQFAGQSVYHAVSHPGYYTSSRFESLISVFAEFSGTEVLELASPMTNDAGEEYYGFDLKTREKYGLGPDQIRYTMRYDYMEIQNVVYFSELQEDSYYYAYSEVFNTICKVPLEKSYFLEWEDEAYLLSRIVYLNIDKCDSIKIQGSYYALPVDGSGRDGLQKIDEFYQLTGTGKNLVITNKEGKQPDVATFREFYQILLSIANRSSVSEADAEAAMKKEAVATIEVSTRQNVVYKVDANGYSTGEEAYVLESVTKKFRFYELTDGRLFCTIEEIKADGTSSGESGSFYVLTSRLEQLFKGVQDLRDGKVVNEKDRY